MLNLLINAIKAAGQNGQIFSCLIADKDKVIFSVSNTGTSLNAEKFKSILDAESGANPHGFGLWVCQELANHYGGGFYLDDIADNKTRLVFWVPNRESKGKNL
jgi:signal transduction histidine kinase